MKIISSLCLAVVGITLFACPISASASSLPKGEQYKSIDGGIIRVISSNEVETVHSGENIVGTYSVDKGVARMVFEVLGTKIANYYELVGDGLKDKKTGKIYYSSSKYEAAKKKYEEEKAKKALEQKLERERKEKEAAIARENAAREAQERQAKEKKESQERRQKEDKEAQVRREKEERNEALISATDKCDKTKVQLLLDQGVDLNTVDYNWRTALMIASRDGCLEIVKLLIQYKVDINYKNNWGMTALDWAKREKKSDIIKLLLENGAK